MFVNPSKILYKLFVKLQETLVRTCCDGRGREKDMDSAYGLELHRRSAKSREAKMPIGADDVSVSSP